MSAVQSPSQPTALQRLVNLPKGEIWDKGTAPVERFGLLERAEAELALDTFSKINKQGERADTKTLREVDANFDAVISALEQSRPVYVEPREKYVLGGIMEDAKKKGPDGTEAVAFVVSYRPHDQNNPLVEWNSIKWDQRDIHWYDCNLCTKDNVAEKLAKLISGFKKVKKMVIQSLRKAGPASEQKAGILNRKSVDQVVHERFSRYAAILHEIANDARIVNESGFDVDMQYNYVLPSSWIQTRHLAEIRYAGE